MPDIQGKINLLKMHLFYHFSISINKFSGSSNLSSRKLAFLKLFISFTYSKIDQ